MKIPILMYHYVRPAERRLSNRHKVLELNLFNRQIAQLRSQYTFVVSNQLRQIADDNKPKQKNIWLTFDDGYRDCIDYVLPSLLKAAVSATFYVPTEAIFDRKLLDVNKIHILLSADLSIIEIINSVRQSYDDLKIDDQTGWSFEKLFEKHGVANLWNNQETEFIKKIFQKLLSKAQRTQLLDFVFSKLIKRSESSWVDELYLSPDNVRTLIESGMEVGSHGHSHEWLAELSPAEQLCDLNQSFEVLNSELKGRHVKSLSYPFGSYNEETLKILRNAQIETAVVNSGQRYADVRFDSESPMTLELDRIDIMFFDKFMSGDFS